MIPKDLSLLFWDTNLADFDPAAYPFYTIERVLEYGDDEVPSANRCLTCS